MDGQKRRVSELKQKMQKLEQFMVGNIWYYSIVSKSISVQSGINLFFQIFIQEFVGYKSLQQLSCRVASRNQPT